MDLYPAIDLRGGQVVQLVQGDFTRERVHGDDPVAVAQAFVAAGATALGVHVEACTHLHRTLSQIRKLGVRPCVVLNPATPASAHEIASAISL